MMKRLILFLIIQLIMIFAIPVIAQLAEAPENPAMANVTAINH